MSERGGERGCPHGAPPGPAPHCGEGGGRAGAQRSGLVVIRRAVAWRGVAWCGLTYPTSNGYSEQNSRGAGQGPSRGLAERGGGGAEPGRSSELQHRAAQGGFNCVHSQDPREHHRLIIGDWLRRATLRHAPPLA